MWREDEGVPPTPLTGVFSVPKGLEGEKLAYGGVAKLPDSAPRGGGLPKRVLT